MALIKPIATLFAKLREYARDSKAVAAVEFALILPPLLVLYLGSIEGSSLITVDRRIEIVSGTMGDLIARWDPDAGAIDNATLQDYFQASNVILFPYSRSTLTMSVSIVEVQPDDTVLVVKSCAYNGGTAHAVGSEYAVPLHMRNLGKGASGFLIASEAAYTYTPTLGDIFLDPFPLYAESFYLPRYEEEVTLPANC